MPQRAKVSGARAPLTRVAIVDAAIALVERDGPGSLTMRRLGSELGVEAMSLYHHVANREELVDAIAEQMLEPLRRLELSGDWREACCQFADALREVAVTRPGAFALVGLEPLDTRGSLQAVERLLSVLVDGGFSAPDALAVYRAVASYARGYALAEATGFTVDAAAPAGRRRLRGLPAAEFPILCGRVEELAELDPETSYVRGRDALIAGLPDPA